MLARPVLKDQPERPALPERSTLSRRSARASQSPALSERPRPSPAPESLSPAADVDPALRTARWMIHAYGPLEAEGKALSAAEFYTGDDSAFWRRVVGYVRAER